MTLPASRTTAAMLAVCLAFGASAPARAQASLGFEPPLTQPGAVFSPWQLDNLLAPIALYPDPLLAQALLASTFVDQLRDADALLRGGVSADVIDGLSWDISVKAVAHYPQLLALLNHDLDWTTALGQAHLHQAADVFAAVQRLRRAAHLAGHLHSTPQQIVTVLPDHIRIEPAQAQLIHLPVYDPGRVYDPRLAAPVHGSAPALVSFGAGLLIGSWLVHDFDWRARRIHYHGWRGDGWVQRSRPRIAINSVYVDPVHRDVRLNPRIGQRPLDHGHLARHDWVHRAAVDRGHTVRSPDGPRGPWPGADRGDERRRPPATASHGAGAPTPLPPRMPAPIVGRMPGPAPAMVPPPPVVSAVPDARGGRNFGRPPVPSPQVGAPLVQAAPTRHGGEPAAQQGERAQRPQRYDRTVHFGRPDGAEGRGQSERR